jgi:mono/diheme cytochrome c family protein
LFTTSQSGDVPSEVFSIMKRSVILLMLLTLFLAACGTVATPVFQVDLEETQVAAAATSDAATANAPTFTPTATITATATATALPTNTATDRPTESASDTPLPPTAVPTQEEAETGDAEVAGDPAAGQLLFTTFVAQASFACNTCHLPDSESMLIGPGLQHVGERGATRVEGLTAPEYIRQSILEPSAFVVDGFVDNLMPKVYGQVFSDEDIDDLIAYLMTL